MTRPTGYSRKSIKDLVPVISPPVSSIEVTINNSIKQQEGNNMSTTRRVVTVTLMDDDKGLDVADSLVCKFKNIVTEDDNQTVIQEVIMDKDIAAALSAHNEKRASTLDMDILQRTGNEVYLRPVKLKNLRWVVA